MARGDRWRCRAAAVRGEDREATAFGALGRGGDGAAKPGRVKRHGGARRRRIQSTAASGSGAAVAPEGGAVSGAGPGRWRRPDLGRRGVGASCGGGRRCGLHLRTAAQVRGGAPWRRQERRRRIWKRRERRRRPSGREREAAGRVEQPGGRWRRRWPAAVEAAGEREGAGSGEDGVGGGGGQGMAALGRRPDEGGAIRGGGAREEAGGRSWGGELQGGADAMDEEEVAGGDGHGGG